MKHFYDTIGLNYSNLRKPDPRIAALLESKLGDAQTIVNIGAGTGSYEPKNKHVIAVEPSSIMIAQRPTNSAPVTQCSAEDLPFSDNQFDLSLAILTIHHWQDQLQGLNEMKRVSKRQLIFTWNPLNPGFWLTQNYFPEILSIDKSIFPRLSSIEKVLGSLNVHPVPIPADCSDGFGCAYWNRPEAYLSDKVRLAISTFNKINKVEEGVTQLRQDIKNGTWDRNYGHLRQLEEFDLGYVLLSSTDKL